MALLALALSYQGVVSLNPRHQDIDLALGLFVLATALLVFASRGLAYPNAGPSSASNSDDFSASFRSRLSWPRAYWFVVLGFALTLAFVFRTYELGSKPYGVWFDEAQNGIVAREILHGARPVFVSGATQLPALFFYVFALSIKLFGSNILALRLVSTAAGIGAVFFTYLLGKELFSERTGVLAAFFLAVMRWHVNFSRFAMHGIFAPLFEVIALYFIVRGLKDKGLWNFLVAGIAVGIGLQGYYSFIILPAVAGLFIIHHAIFEKTMPLKRLGKGIAILSISTALVYAPMASWALHHWTQFSERSQTVSITNGRSTSQVIKVAETSARKHLLMFSAAGDRNGRHNIPGAPMLDQITALLFVLGFGFSLFHIRRSPYFLLVVWAVLALQSGILSLDFEAPQAYRTVGITPAIALLAAVPLDRLWQIGASFSRNRGQSARADGFNWATLGLAALAVPLLFVCARTNFRNYFDVQLIRPDATAAYSIDATFAAKSMKRLGENHDIRLGAVLAGQPTIQFLDSAAIQKRTKAFKWTLDIPSTSPDGTLYVLDAAKEPFWDWLKQVYPNGSFAAFNNNDPRGPILAYEALIPGSEVSKFTGLAATYTAPGVAPVQTREPDLNLDWSKSAPLLTLPLTASWQGILRVPTYGDHKLSFDVPGSARILIDGNVVAEGIDHLEWSGKAYRGDHEITVEAEVARPGAIALKWDGDPVSPQMLLNYPLQGHGLIASYFQNATWSGEPKEVELEPFVGIKVHSELDDIGVPFSVLWSGFIEIPATADYTFELQVLEKGTLKIDSTDVTAQLGKPLHLAQGRHPIEVTLLNRVGDAEAFFYWLDPVSGKRVVVPPQQLYPR